MKFYLPISFLLTFASFLPGQSQFYFSFSDLGDGNASSNTTSTFDVGDTGSAFLWIDGEVMVDSLVGSNIVSSDPSILAIESVEVFNPDILITVGDDQSVLGLAGQML